MGTKLICDYCLKEISSNYTIMRIQTVDTVGTTAQGDTDNFEFHPGCYNVLQGLIVQLRGKGEVLPIDPTPKPPKEQPTNPDDPTPILPA